MGDATGASPALGDLTTGTARSKPWRRRDAAWLLAPALLYLVVFSVFPFIYSLWASLNDWDKRTSTFTFIGLANYAELLSDPLFWQALWTSALMVGGAIAAQVALGTALAIFFNRRLRGSWLVRGILIFPMLLTPVVVGLMWRALLNPEWGLVNWIIRTIGLTPPNWFSDANTAIVTLIVVDTWQWTPFIFVVVYARLQALPVEVFECAAVDGVNRRDRLWHITLPLLAPAIALAAIFRAIDAFRSFDLIYGLTYGGPGRATATVSFLVYQNGFQFQRYGYASAIGYVMVVVLVLATTLLFRYVSLRREDAA
jgi:multiple sugar transport system permease protein